jgi:hypothetical protein
MPFEAGVMRLDWLAELGATELEIGAVTGPRNIKRNLTLYASSAPENFG